MTASRRKRVSEMKSVNRYAGGRVIAQAVLALLLLGVGGTAAGLFVKFRRPPVRVEEPNVAPLVKVVQLHERDIRMTVTGYGTVKPKAQVEIIPEVAGKIVAVHPQLQVGGVIRAGEQLLQIDRRDYELAVQQAKASVAEAQVRLDMELAEAEVARREWESLHPGEQPDSSLVLREPQVRQAKALLESAKAQLEMAKLRLERTVLSFPFDVLIASERVDLGQYVVAGQSLGVAYGIDAVEIEVPLEDSELAWFDVRLGLPDGGADGLGVGRASAVVEADFGGGQHRWSGYVTRTTGQVDRTSRMVSVVVEVPHPFEDGSGRYPLLPGTFVKVSIRGRLLKGAVAVPRAAIRNGREVWVVNEGRLHVRRLDIARTDHEFAYVRSGLSDGELVVISVLDAVTEGMKVRTELVKQDEMRLGHGGEALEGK